jgi:hypothetical protein
MGEASPLLTAGPTSGLVGPAPDAVTPAPLDLADALSQRIAMDLDAIRERYRRGARDPAVAELGRLLAEPAWSHLDQGLRGRILRTAALYRLTGGDTSEAEALAFRAATEDPEGDAQVLEANLALRRGDTVAALALLEVPRSPQARNLKTAMLIGAGDAQAALEFLDLPAEVTDAMAEVPATSPIGYQTAPGNDRRDLAFAGTGVARTQAAYGCHRTIEEARAPRNGWPSAAPQPYWTSGAPARRRRWL